MVLTNKLPRGKAIEVLQEIVYSLGVLNHNLRASLRRSGYTLCPPKCNESREGTVHRPRAAEALAEAQAEREGGIKPVILLLQFFKRHNMPHF